MNVGVLIVAALFFSCLVYILYCFAESIASSLAGWISKKRMEKEGHVLKLVYREGERPWVMVDEDAMQDRAGDFRKKEVRRTKPKKLDKGTRKKLDSPSKEELDRLKKKLQVASGCLCFKHGAVYVVTCEGKKRRWRRLGRWEQLRQKVAK